jgi:hypothetical protein
MIWYDNKKRTTKNKNILKNIWVVKKEKKRTDSLLHFSLVSTCPPPSLSPLSHSEIIQIQSPIHKIYASTTPTPKPKNPTAHYFPFHFYKLSTYSSLFWALETLFLAETSISNRQSKSFPSFHYLHLHLHPLLPPARASNFHSYCWAEVAVAEVEVEVEQQNPDQLETAEGAVVMDVRLMDQPPRCRLLMQGLQRWLPLPLSDGKARFRRKMVVVGAGAGLVVQKVGVVIFVMQNEVDLDQSQGWGWGGGGGGGWCASIWTIWGSRSCTNRRHRSLRLAKGFWVSIFGVETVGWRAGTRGGTAEGGCGAIRGGVLSESDI